MPGLLSKWFAFLQEWPKQRQPPVLIPPILRGPKVAIAELNFAKGRIDVLNMKCAITLLHEPQCVIDGIYIQQPNVKVLATDPACEITEL